MKDKKSKIDRFIELRAMSYTYDEITVLIDVSKPTLIDWGKQFEKQIKIVELLLAEELGRKIVLKNKKLIESIADAAIRIGKQEIREPEVKNRIIGRMSKKLYKIFKRKMDRIELTINNNSTIRSVNIVWMDNELSNQS